jgi:hypothetical protein
MNEYLDQDLINPKGCVLGNFSSTTRFQQVGTELQRRQ